MSLLQHLFNPFIFPATASRDATSRRIATLTAGHIGANGPLRCDSNHSSSPTSLHPTPTSRISYLAHAYRSYGLGFLIATNIGLHTRLGSLSHTNISPVNAATSTTSRTSTTAASSSLPATPEPHATHRGACGRIRFARSKPPGVEWGVQASVHRDQDSLIASGSGSSDRKHALSDTLVDSRWISRSPSQDVIAWLKVICQEGLPEEVVSSTHSDASSQASPFSPPRRFADASVQTDDVSVRPSLPSVPTVSSAPHSYTATEPYPSVRGTSNSLVPTAPNSLVPTEIDESSAAHDDEEEWASAPLTESDDAKAAQKKNSPVIIPLAALPTNSYNDNWTENSYPDIVEHNGVEYQILGMLGEGSFGRVFFAFTSTGKSVALKTFHKPKCYRWPSAKEELVNERNFLALAAEQRLPFWTSLNAAWEDSCNVYMEMDMCTGSLRDLIRRCGASMSANELKLLCAEMLLSVADLKKHQIVHGDIKPENFLVRPDGRVVLADFGFATKPPMPLTSSDFTRWETTRGGTPGYMAPAVLAENGYCSHQTDIFSLGVVFLELMAGLRDPLWDTTATGVPQAYSGPKEAWFALRMEERQGWLINNVGLSEVEEALRGQQGLALCKEMIFGEPTIERLKKHRYFHGVDFDQVYDGLVTHDYKPHFGDIRTSAAKRDLTFAAWHRYEEAPAEYGNAVEFAYVVNDHDEVVYPCWVLDNEAAREQMAEPLANFEWPERPRTRQGAAAAPSMLFRRPAPPRVSPSPAPSGFHRTPGHRPQGPPAVPPGLPRPVAPPSPHLAPLHPPDSPLPLAQMLPPLQHHADLDYFPPPGLSPLEGLRVSAVGNQGTTPHRRVPGARVQLCDLLN